VPEPEQWQVVVREELGTNEVSGKTDNMLNIQVQLTVGIPLYWEANALPGTTCAYA